MYACGREVEATEHFLLLCHLCPTQRLEPFENVKKVDSSFLNLNNKYNVSFIYIVLNQKLPKVSITLFLNL